MTVARVALALATALAGGWGLAAAALDVAGGAPPPEGDYAAIVVAGAGVLPGGVAGTPLRNRSLRAAELYTQGMAPVVLFTGGVGDWPPSEASVGAAIALQAGVPEGAVALEELSATTEQNALQARATLGDVPVLVVTDRFHAVRCRRVFARHFSSVEVVGVSGPARVRVRFALREVVAVLWYAATGRM